jgi:hypothetical protein
MTRPSTHSGRRPKSAKARNRGRWGATDGGNGNDTIVFRAGSGIDTVSDFGQAGDHDVIRFEGTQFTSLLGVFHACRVMTITICRILRRIGAAISQQCCDPRHKLFDFAGWLRTRVFALRLFRSTSASRNPAYQARQWPDRVWNAWRTSLGARAR